MKRRSFLELTVVSAGALLPACGSDNLSSEPSEVREADFPQSVASGDPRPNSVVLWTRAPNPEQPEQDLELSLTLAMDAEMHDVVLLQGEPSLKLIAEARFDHCVKVRVDGLHPGTHYYYRFQRRVGVGWVSSRTGRTKTAPPEDADVAVRFAVASCQDFDRKYYHLYRLLRERDLDFFVHLGDYVYESIANPSSAALEREVRVGRPEQAQQSGANAAWKARSLDNYRDLYRTVRSDRDLQGMHESVPMIAIWDDHEFSNDCYGATGTYEEGRVDETDLERRAAADQAWFEYMPVDYSVHPATAWSDAAGFPDNFAIYRSFVFGTHVELVMTDLRRHRPDHVVPEDAFPGALFATEEELLESGFDVSDLEFVPSVDIESFADGVYADWLREHAARFDFRAEAIQGQVSVPFLNALLEQLNADDQPAPIEAEPVGLVRGCAYHQLLKNAGFSSAGARYLVALQPFLALAHLRYQQSQGASERLMGSAQRTWFLDRLKRSTRTFKFWGSSVCFMPRQLDLRAAESLPEEFRARLLITAEDWDGFPNERAALFQELRTTQNLVVLSGDLHCFFVGTPVNPAEPGHRILEFVTGSISSSTWLREIRAIAEADASLPPAVALAASAVGNLLSDPVARPNPHLAFQDLENNGVTLMRVNAEGLQAELLLLSPEDVARPPEAVSDNLAERSHSIFFRVRTDRGDLERDADARAWRWDPAQGSWVLADE